MIPFSCGREQLCCSRLRDETTLNLLQLPNLTGCYFSLIIRNGFLAYTAAQQVRVLPVFCIYTQE